MKTIKLSLLILGATLFVSNINAQSTGHTGDWCGTDYLWEEMIQNDPALEQQRLAFRAQVREYMDTHPQSNSGAETAPYIIPMVFHCITDNGAGYISKADIDDAILTLNEDFTRTNTDASNTRSLFAPYAGGTSIQFRLAHIDPNGDCTQGIVRLDSPLSTDANDNVKPLSRWPYNDYFNVWVVNSIDLGGGGAGTTLGYAYQPWSGLFNGYGIVVDNDYVGRSERTLTHEMGHSLGLDHTFDGGCGNAGSNCATQGDGCCDTPPSVASTFGCDGNQNTCLQAFVEGPYGANVVDQIENYMSYDQCQNMFSLEQIAWMEVVLNSSAAYGLANKLTNSANWNQTGVNDPYGPVNCAPIADFTYDRDFICAGQSVTYSDDSYDGIPNAWSWNFTGGTPNSSSSPSPVIVYNTPGVYSATYQPTSPGGTGNLVVKTNIITVSSLTADYVGPLVEGFEISNDFTNDWTIINHEGSGFTWERTGAIGYTGSFSARVRNVYNVGTDKHDLISPSYDLSAMASKTMTFKQAFAKKLSTNTDKLLISYSLNCGESWTITLPLLTSSSIATAPNQSTEFVPNSTQWLERVVDLTPIGNETNVRFRFEFTEGGGNNCYIDDINIGDFFNGVDDFSSIASFSVFPNPTNSSAQISFNLTKDINNLSIKVKNSIGQVVTNVINGQSFNTGKYTLKIDEQRKLASGIYFIEFNADDNVKIQKLIVQ